MELVDRVNDFLDSYLNDKIVTWRKEIPEAEPLGELARRYVLQGGKRLRAQFAYWGYVSADGDPESPDVIRLAAALELLHAFALVHDDVMDAADERRGVQTVHAEFMKNHATNKWGGESRRYGEGVAILLGDLLFALSNSIVSGLNETVRQIWSETSAELCLGQFIDMQTGAEGWRSTTAALTVARYKSGKYTVERPLQLGSALATNNNAWDDIWTSFGIPLGEAFQLRDDVLAINGMPATTGKPVGDDLKEGKATYLVALAESRANESQRAVLSKIGDRSMSDAELDLIVGVIIETGALTEAEEQISRRAHASLAMLGAIDVPDAARLALASLLASAVDRAS